MITKSLYDGKEYAIEIANDQCYCYTDRGTVAIPQPTLGFLLVYQERESYFRDPELGVGRILVALKHQQTPGYSRAIKNGGEIPDEEARAAQADAHPDRDVYYAMIHRAFNYGAEECERKLKLLYAERRRHAS